MAAATGPETSDGRLLRYVMTAPASARYSTEGDVSGPPPTRRLLSAFPGVNLSPCLTRAAAAYARLVPHEAQTQPPLAAIEFLLHWAGCPDPSATATVLYTTEDSTAEVAAGLRQLLARPEARATTDLGLARVPAENPPFRWRWGIFAVERTARLRGFPASGDPGATLPLQFRLADGLTNPSVVLLGTDGRIEHPTVGHSGRWGLARIPLGPRKGTLWVEIVGEGAGGPRVCALFPVAVGGPPPQVWQGPRPPDESDIRTHAQAEALMLELVNADRLRFGLPSLTADQRLAAIARRHSKDMVATDYFGHVSPSRGNLSARLGASHYAVTWSGENISASDSIYESQEALMRSPGHRANILSPQPTVLGIGIVRRTDAGHRTWVVTQIFAQPVADLSVQSFVSQTRAMIGRRRASHGRTMLRSDEAVDAAAAELAAGLHRRALSQKALVAEAGRVLRNAGVRYHRLTVLTYEVPEPNDIALPEEIDRATVQVVGVGAARKSGEPLTTVVVLLIEGGLEAVTP